ncbi:hypothetical protein BDR03DRAFT_230486, partial [Suillus americanus]
MSFCPYSLDANNQRFIHPLETVERTSNAYTFVPQHASLALFGNAKFILDILLVPCPTMSVDL